MQKKNGIAIPPGETIKELLQDQGIEKAVFAQRMGMTEEEIDGLLVGSCSLTPDIAKHLEEVLGIPRTFWIRLEKTYRMDLQTVKQDLFESEKDCQKG